MEHAEALERIEIAATEPEGLDRLMAGDTPEAASVAGHLAGCQSCSVELTRIRRTSGIVRETIRLQPDPALRDRTLAFVRAVGRDRSGSAAGAAPVGASEPSAPGSPAGTLASLASDAPRSARSGDMAPAPLGRRRSIGSFRFGWPAAIAAALVLAVSAFAVGGALQRGDSDGQATEIALLEHTTLATLAIQAQPDARSVVLAPSSGAAMPSGTLLFSPGTGQLVMVAQGLAQPAAGQEYGCWLEQDGTRTRIGKMYFVGDIATWVGPVSGLDAVAPGAQFGVSIGPLGGGASSEPVLTGRL